MPHAVLFLVLAASLAPLQRAPEDPLSGFNDITLDQPTPHVAWGQPLQGGPVDVLAIAPRFALRDTVELAQRLQIRCDTVPLWDAHHLGYDDAGISVPVPGASSGETRERLMNRLAESWDVILLGNFDWSVLPDEAVQALIAHVQDGTGVLIASFGASPLPTALQSAIDPMEPADTAPITRGVGQAVNPEWKKGLDFLTAGKLGKGRIVLLNHAGAAPKTHFLIPPPVDSRVIEHEYVEANYSLLGKAIAWAAQRESDIWIEGLESAGPVSPIEEEIPPYLPEAYIRLIKESNVPQPFNPYRVRLNKPADQEYAVRVQIRQPGRNYTNVYSTYEESIPLRKGDTDYPIVLGLGSGTHCVDLWLLRKGEVVDWHTAVVEIQRWPDITDLKFSKQTVLPNDTLGISLDIIPPLNEDLYMGLNCQVVARASDPLQRIVATSVRSLPGRSGHVEMNLDLADLLCPLVKVEVFVVDTVSAASEGGAPPNEAELARAAYAFRYFPVRQPFNPQAFALVAGTAPGVEYNGTVLDRILARQGADWLDTPNRADGVLLAGKANMRPLPRLTQHVPEAINDGVRQPCLTDPAFLKSEAARLEQAMLDPWLQGLPLFSLGNGNCLVSDDSNVCVSPTCLAGFQRWLEAEYGSVSSLNAAWSTDYGDWTDVRPSTLQAVRASGRFAPWIDHRQYMDTVFASIHTFSRDMLLSLRKADSTRGLSNRVGFSALPHPTPQSGYDWSQLASELDLLGVPPDVLTVEKVRSYRNPNGFAALLCGTGMDTVAPERLPWYPWYALLRGLDGIWYETGWSDAQQAVPWTALGPDGRPRPALSRMSEELVEIRGGLDELIAGSSREHAPIALYDSAASHYLSLAEPSFGGGAPQENAPLVQSDVRTAHDVQEAFALLLADLGYAFDFVSPAHATQRKLGEYKLLILPLARALSDAEVKAVQDFQAAGGHVVADVAPGEFDAHCVRRTVPALDTLFGVARTDAPRAGAPSESSFDEDTGAKTLHGIVPDLSVTAADATPLGHVGDAPAWLRRAGSGGNTLLMNHAMPDYGRLDSSDAASLRILLGNILREAKLIPEVALRPGKDGFHGMASAFQFGKARVIGILRDPSRGEAVEKVEVDTTGAKHVYDMRSGSTVRSRNATLKLDRGQPALLSCLPYAVTGLNLQTPESISPGRRLTVHVAVETRGGLPDKHLVRIEVAPIAGMPLVHYGKNVLCEAGKGTTYIPLGLWEKPVTYRVMAWDVLTGTYAESQVKVVADDLNAETEHRRK